MEQNRAGRRWFLRRWNICQALLLAELSMHSMHSMHTHRRDSFTGIIARKPKNTEWRIGSGLKQPNHRQPRHRLAHLADLAHFANLADQANLADKADLAQLRQTKCPNKVEIRISFSVLISVMLVTRFCRQFISFMWSRWSLSKLSKRKDLEFVE